MAAGLRLGTLTVGAQRRHLLQASPQFVAHLRAARCGGTQVAREASSSCAFYGYLRPRLPVVEISMIGCLQWQPAFFLLPPPAAAIDRTL